MRRVTYLNVSPLPPPLGVPSSSSSSSSTAPPDTYERAGGNGPRLLVSGAAFLFLFTLVLAANLFADAVRDAFDPRLRR